DQAAPVRSAEDEQDRGEAEDDRPGRHRDLGANREGEDGGAGGAGQGRDQERLLGAGAAGSEGDDVGDRLNPHPQQHVPDRTAEREVVEEEPEGGKAEEPADSLPGGYLTQVAPWRGEDDHALADPVPEAPHPLREEVDAERDRQQQPQDREPERFRVVGPEGDLESPQGGALGQRAQAAPAAW